MSYGLDASSASVKYQPARIIECTQNVVELRKLISNLQRLENNRKQSLTTLENEKHALETQYNRIIGAEPESALEESFKLEPGFRFKANGDIKKPKKNDITKVVEYIKNWKSIKHEYGKKKPNKKPITIPTEARDVSNPKLSKILLPHSEPNEILEVARENSTASMTRQNAHVPRAHSNILETFDREQYNWYHVSPNDSYIGTENVTKSIAETERDLQEFGELRKAIIKPSSTHYLRAWSKENQYSGGPYAVKSLRSQQEINRIRTQAKSCSVTQQRGFKHNCSACEFKLAQSFGKLPETDRKLTELQRPLQKWLTPSTGNI